MLYCYCRYWTVSWAKYHLFGQLMTDMEKDGLGPTIRPLRRSGRGGGWSFSWDFGWDGTRGRAEATVSKSLSSIRFSPGPTPPSAIVILHLTPSSLPPQPSVTPEEVSRFTRPPLPRGWCAVTDWSGVGRDSSAETTEVGWLDVGIMLGSCG